METKQILIRLRPETHDLMKAYYKQRNHRSFSSYIDELIVTDLSELKDEEERLETAQRNAGSIS